jgi:hypothetical protein
LESVLNLYLSERQLLNHGHVIYSHEKHTLIQQEPTPFFLSQCTSTIVPTLRRSRVFEEVSFTGRCADDPEIERGISRAAEDQPAKNSRLLNQDVIGRS